MIRLLLGILCRCAMIHHKWMHIDRTIYQCVYCHECSAGHDPEMP